ncbi:MAG: TetR/AcrR family transcriptional regulator [Bradymonadia bacterium]
MRSRLLEATLDCLQAEGFSGTTVTRIIEQAGVSRGAYVHHFPNKLDLFAAASDHLVRQTLRRVEQMIQGLDREADRLDAMLDFLWTELTHGRLGTVFLELMVAARSDSKLLERLHPITRRRQQISDVGWRMYFAATPRAEAAGIGVEAVMNMTTWLVRGMALEAAISDEPEATFRAHLTMLRTLIEPLVQARLSAPDCPSSTPRTE